MSNLNELMAKRSVESKVRIKKRTDELRREIVLSLLREELNISQTELAAAMGVKQPTLAKIEKSDNDPRLSTLKRYIEAMGGKLSLTVEMPAGNGRIFHI
ncbi:helix-turn-helix transcriptional regulator [Shewanella sp. DC2-4]|jgi:predicted transcriptional regulator|uniref:helix-turn-helix domain-containing protein n=1 Tax=Shewanella sp. DC2-4 TaxID=2739431 RepID=UPI001565E0BD|nr:helix-turn-helix transcriptional regulator [Shewanella sp. DC2-4]NRD30317.1 helix-turn-helix transcriptional regulator [Shewanella sp. DC2-4]